MSYYSNMESEEQERKLFVGGLNKSVTDEERLRNFFKDFGSIIDCTIMRDNDKHSRGFGFVLFEKSSSVDDIIAAKKEGSSFNLDDHHIEVKRALPKVPGGGPPGFPRSGGLHRKIFVGGLPSTITEDDLRSYFSQFGRVNEVELLRDRETTRLRGFAFVTFDDEDAADKCIQRRTHEICKKVCEVKRAQTRSTLNKFEEERSGGGFSGRDRDDRERRGGGAGNQGGSSGLSMAEVNQLIQQAFAMGQHSVLHPSAGQAPTASSLLGFSPGNSYGNNAPPNVALLQALMNQQNQAPPAPAPIAPSPVSAPQSNNNSNAISKLAQLLSTRGIDPNTLTALLNEGEGRSGGSAKGGSGNGYPTSYPTPSAYDLYYGQQGSSNFGPTKPEDDGKRGYRPY